MSSSIDKLDADWAWAPYQPDAELPWTSRLAAHLHRRAGFAIDSEELAASVAQGPQETLRTLLSPPPASADDIDDGRRLAESALATGNPKSLEGWWLYQMLNASDPLLEKMTLFWHGHFATGAEKVTDPRLMFEQNELLRRHALGHFGPLVQEVSRDPAMLIYLDSVTNRKQHPNENYAREVMELFCLGEGQYSEQDIRELARCFSGWEIKRGKFKFNRYQHDEGAKSILGRKGEFDGEQGVEIVLDQPACPEFIVRKLLRFLVFDDIVPTTELVAPLIAEFRRSDLNVGEVVHRILASNLFFSPAAVGRKVRSPVELGIGLLRAFQGTTNLQALAEGLARIGQEVFYPPNVKGWDGGRAWINSSTLLGRANVVRQVLRNDKTRFGGGSLEELMGEWKLRNSTDIVNRWCELLLAVEIPEAALEQIVGTIDEGEGNREQRLREALCLLCTLPAFQLA